MANKKLKAVLLMLITALALASCGGSTVLLERQEPSPSTGKSWTVLVYMCGGTEDSKIPEKALEEMMSADYSANVNFVVETGGAGEWSLNGIDPDFNQRFLMQHKSMYLAGQTAKANMASSDVLTDFLAWGKKNFPADRYMLIVSGQGGGALYGAGLDAETGDTITLEDVTYSISSADIPIDAVVFDSSFMSSLETAAGLAPYARYMVASEDMMCPYGIDYAALAGCLVSNPDASTEDICRVICDSYYEKCGSYGMKDTATIAVTDLSRITELTQAFDGMAGMMSFAMEDLGNGARMLRRLEYLKRLGGQSAGEGYTDMADLMQLAQTIQPDMGATADLLISLLDEIVIYSVNGPKRSGVKGLGVYYPFSGTADSINRYTKIFPSHNYLTYARKVSVSAQTELGEGETDYNSTQAYREFAEQIPYMTLNAFENGDACYQLDVDTNMLFLKDICMDVYSYDAKTGESYMAGTKYDIDGSIDGTLFTSEFPTTVLGVNGHAVYAERTERGENYEVYAAPVLLNGNRASVRIYHDNERGSYSVMGAWTGIDPETGLEGRGFRKLKTGDKITPLFELYGGLGTKEGTPFRIGIAGAHAGMAGVTGGKAYRYRLTDMYGGARTADMYIREQ